MVFISRPPFNLMIFMSTLVHLYAVMLLHYAQCSVGAVVWAMHYAQCGCCGLGLALCTVWMLWSGPCIMHSVDAVVWAHYAQCGCCGLGHALCTVWMLWSGPCIMHSVDAVVWALHYAQCGCCGLGALCTVWMLWSGPCIMHSVRMLWPRHILCILFLQLILVVGVDPGFSEGGRGGGGANGTWSWQGDDIEGVGEVCVPPVQSAEAFAINVCS